MIDIRLLFKFHLSSEMKKIQIQLKYTCLFLMTVVEFQAVSSPILSLWAPVRAEMVYVND